MTRIEWEEDKTAVAALVSSALYLSVGLAGPVVTLITSRGSQERLGPGNWDTSVNRANDTSVTP